MQCAGKACEHDTQAGTIGENGRERIEVWRGIVERACDTRSCWTGKNHAELTLVEVIKEVVELAEFLLGFHLAPKP